MKTSLLAVLLAALALIGVAPARAADRPPVQLAAAGAGSAHFHGGGGGGFGRPSPRYRRRGIGGHGFFTGYFLGRVFGVPLFPLLLIIVFVLLSRRRQ